MTTLLRPPDLPERLPGHSIVTGSAGAGKSSFLAAIARSTPSFSASVSLVELLGSLSRRPQTRRASSSENARLVLASLLLSVARSLARSGLAANQSAVREVLPAAFAVDIVEGADGSPASAVDPQSTADVPTLLAALDAVAPEGTLWGPPVLLVDDLNLVGPELRRAILELQALDRWTVVAATRPSWPSLWGPGWHPLEIRGPRAGGTWSDFADTVVDDRLPGVRVLLGGDAWTQLLALSADSLGSALMLATAASRGSTRQSAWRHVEAIASELRSAQLVALGSYSSNFRKVIAEVRQQAIERYACIPSTLAVELERRHEAPGEVAMFIAVGVRSGALEVASTTTSSTRVPERLRIHPLLMWTPETPLDAGPRDAPSVTRDQRHLLYPERWARRRRVTLVASDRAPHQTVDSVSDRIAVRARDDATLRRIAAADRFVCEGGEVEDIAFQTGFAVASGHGSVTVPRTFLSYAPSMRLPFICATDDAGFRRSGGAHDRERRPIPGSIVWTGDAVDSRIAVILRELAGSGLDLELDPWPLSAPPSPATLRRVLVAHVVICAASRSDDARVNFLAGAFRARPDVGYGPASLKRRLLVLAAPSVRLPVGARRCDDLELAHEIAAIRATLAAWRRRRS